MFQIELGYESIVQESGTSEGTQIKYKKDGFWYKQDNRGREGLTEYLVSQLLRYSTLEESEYVIYEKGSINGRPGCRSRDFLKENEELITFYRLYYNEFGRDLSQVIARMDKMEERIEYVLHFIMQSCGLDVADYLAKVFTLDMLVLNEDRHLNNLAVIWDGTEFRPVPIFDNGVSLLTANQSVNWRFPTEDNVHRVVARSFSGSHERMHQYFGQGFLLDLEKVKEWLGEEEDSREKEVLLFQLERYRAVYEYSNKI